MKMPSNDDDKQIIENQLAKSAAYSKQADRKERLVESILDNPVYLPTSGLRENLRKALTKLSASDLAGLDTVIKCKNASV